MADFVEYEIYLGTFEGEDFIWKVIKRFTSFDDAYGFYHDYIMKQSKYDDEELKKIWSSGRIDVELRQGKKLINWCGLFSRRVADPDFDPYAEEKKEADAEEAKASDSADDENMHPLPEGAGPKTYVASIGHKQGSDYTMEEEKEFSDLEPAKALYEELVERCKASGDPSMAASLDAFRGDSHDEELASYNIWEHQ